MSQPASRSHSSVGGLVGAMLVLVVLVVGYTVLRSVTSNDPEPSVQSVDFATQVPAARKAAAFDLVAPARLPTGWRATSVGYTDSPASHWHIGVLTDKDRYVGLEQGNQDVRSAVEQYVDPDATRGGTAQVGGLSWRRYTDTKNDTALVRRAGRTTTLVVGHDVPRAQLEAYVASLR